MSLLTWTEEFYPKEARECVGSNLEMLEHSIRKWRGAIPANMGKHGLKHSAGPMVMDRENLSTFAFNCQTCALCQVYRMEDTVVQPDCTGCPLNEMFGEPCCYSSPDPYAVFVSTGNPQPMIEALTKCLEIETSLTEAKLNQQEKE